MSSPRSDRLLEVEVREGITVARLLRPNFDGSNAQTIGEQLSRLADTYGGGELRLDLGSVQFLSSSGLATLVALHERVRAAGGQLIVDHVAPENYVVFRATGLTEVLEVRPQQPGAKPETRT